MASAVEYRRKLPAARVVANSGPRSAEVTINGLMWGRDEDNPGKIRRVEHALGRLNEVTIDLETVVDTGKQVLTEVQKVLNPTPVPAAQPVKGLGLFAAVDQFAAAHPYMYAAGAGTLVFFGLKSGSMLMTAAGAGALLLEATVLMKAIGFNPGPVTGLGADEGPKSDEGLHTSGYETEGFEPPPRPQGPTDWIKWASDALATT